jgi:hypothetical protein
MAQVHEEACPYEPEARANRCSSCCDATGSLTPCVTAWLNEQVSGRRAGANVVPLHMAVRRSSRQAA